MTGQASLQNGRTCRERQGTSDMKKIRDLDGKVILLFVHEWSVKMVLERNEGLELSEFGSMKGVS